MHNVIESIKEHEGFKSKPYPDPIHGWDAPTFGHGLTWISEDESLWIVQRRLIDIDNRLSALLPWYGTEPSEIKQVLIEMAYQMGVDGLLSFKRTLSLLEDKRYIDASHEMLMSRWYRQTPARAKKLAQKVRAQN